MNLIHPLNLRSLEVFFRSQKNTFERIEKTDLTIYFTNARISIDILDSSPIFDCDVHNTFLLTNLFVCNLLEKKDGIHAFTMGHIFPDCSLYFCQFLKLLMIAEKAVVSMTKELKI